MIEMIPQLATLLVSLVAVLVSPFGGQTTDHAAEWTRRHSQYIDHPEIINAGTRLEISTNSPRPLNDIVEALSKKYAWHVNYEDPQYSATDMVDDTAPAWLKEHPNGPRVHVVAGGAFAVTVPLTKTDAELKVPYASSAERSRVAEPILEAIVSAYNQTANPGRFELRMSADGSFDVVPVSQADRKPLLDTVMTFESKGGDSVESTLNAFCAELQRHSGQSVRGFGGMGINQPYESVEVHRWVKQPAREILRRLLAQLGRTITWSLLYDPDVRNYVLLLRRTA